jgi:hypothetical protein
MNYRLTVHSFETKILCLAIPFALLLGASVSHALPPIPPMIKSYSLAPNFHRLEVIKKTDNGKCVKDVERSVRFDKPFGMTHKLLKTLRLNVYALETSESALKIELVGVTRDQSTRVKIEFFTALETLGYIEEYWLAPESGVPKRRRLALTDAAECEGDPYFMTGFEKLVENR